jgi:signal recognition particle receptor subunit beta
MLTIVVTGASGVGKTSAVNALDARGLAGVRCFYFDSIGVPSLEHMEREHGSGEAWQQWATTEWLARLESLGSEVRVAVLDGQTRPFFVLDAARASGQRVGVVLLDCTDAQRDSRLVDGRNQPELATDRMANWAAYLRREAAALDVPIVDTTALSVQDVADRLQAIVAALIASGSDGSAVWEESR